MAALEVGLDLIDRFVLGGAAMDSEAVVEEGLVRPFDDTVGARRADLSPAVLDVFDGQ